MNLTIVNLTDSECEVRTPTNELVIVVELSDDTNPHITSDIEQSEIKINNQILNESKDDCSVAGLPEIKHGTFYIVSRTIANASPMRSDLLVNDGIVRNVAGALLKIVPVD